MQPTEPPAQPYPPVPQPARSSHRVGRIIGGAAAPLVIVAAVVGCSSSGSKPSDEEQIRRFVAEYAQAINATDANGLNALYCSGADTVPRATYEELSKETDRRGTLSTSIESIEMNADDVATAKVSLWWSKQTDPQETTWYLLREDGSWKTCTKGAIRRYLRD